MKSDDAKTACCSRASAATTSHSHDSSTYRLALVKDPKHRMRWTGCAVLQDGSRGGSSGGGDDDGVGGGLEQLDGSLVGEANM